MGYINYMKDMKIERRKRNGIDDSHSHCVVVVVMKEKKQNGNGSKTKSMMGSKTLISIHLHPWRPDSRSRVLSSASHLGLPSQRLLCLYHFVVVVVKD